MQVLLQILLRRFERTPAALVVPKPLLIVGVEVENSIIDVHGCLPYVECTIPKSERKQSQTLRQGWGRENSRLATIRHYARILRCNELCRTLRGWLRPSLETPCGFAWFRKHRHGDTWRVSRISPCPKSLGDAETMEHCSLPCF